MDRDILTELERACLGGLDLSRRDSPAASSPEHLRPCRSAALTSQDEPAMSWQLAELAAHRLGCGERLNELPFTKDTRFTIRSVNEELAERLGGAFRSLLRCEATCRCESIHAESFAAYVLGLDFPTTFQTIAIPPLEGKLLLELPMETFRAIIERMLGWNGAPTPTGRRPLTTLEHCILERLTGRLLEAFAGAWSSLVTVYPKTERVDHNPRTVRCLRAAEPILISNFRIQATTFTGTLRMAVSMAAMLAACEPDRERARANGRSRGDGELSLRGELDSAGRVLFTTPDVGLSPTPGRPTA